MKIALVLKVIKRFRWLIIGCISAMSILTAGFFGVQGIVYDTAECPTTIVYGEPLTYEASAIMKDLPTRRKLQIMKTIPLLPTL